MKTQKNPRRRAGRDFKTTARRGCVAAAVASSQILSFGFLNLNPAFSQIVPDNTLPVPSQVNLEGNRYTLEGGTAAGNNLFHSFQDFSVPTGSEAFFNNATSIENILTRVTGGNLSHIDGLIRANGTANLFLLNPNGIVFGPNARLDVAGSFFSSTADRIVFENGLEFSATNPQAPSLLSVNVPIGLQWGEPAGEVRVEGTGNPGIFPSAETGLSVRSGQTIALVGGDVTLDGGTIAAPDGRIEVGSVRSGRVDLAEIDSGWRLDYSQVPEFGNIELLSRSSLFVPTRDGNPDGAIRVAGNQIRLLDRSQIASVNRGNSPGSPINIHAVESLEIGGTDETAFPFSSWIVTEVGEGAIGEGGEMTISAPQLTIRDGGRLQTTSRGDGDGGNIAIDSESVLVIGLSPLNPAEVLSAENLNSIINSETYSGGNGGAIEISTTELNVLEAGQVESDVELGATGNGGDIHIEARDAILVSGFVPVAGAPEFDIDSRIQSRTLGAGDGGSIRVLSDRLVADSGGKITTSVFPFPEESMGAVESGNAGDLTLEARESFEIITRGNTFLSTSVVGSITYGSGEAGNVTVSTERLTLRDGGVLASQVLARTLFGEPLPSAGTGNGNHLTVNADSIEVLGTIPSGIIVSLIGTVTAGSGDAGDTVINTRRLVVDDGGAITTSTVALGDAGNLTVNASESIEIVGQQTQTGRQIQNATTQIAASASLTTEGFQDVFSAPPVTSGNTGTVTINTERLSVRDSGSIGVSHFGTGNAGELSVNASEIFIDDGGFIRASTAAGLGGNLTVNAGSLQLRDGSFISTEAGGTGNGGNIAINTETIALLEGSRITANALEGQGGNIQIETQGLFVSPDSRITASSQFGVDGLVTITQPEIDTSAALVQLSSEPIDPTTQVVSACRTAVDNTFVVTGNGGLPPDPTEVLRGQTVWVDTRLSDFIESSPSAENHSSEEEEESSIAPPPLVEATGWQRHENGTVELVATPQNRVGNPRGDRVNCRERF